MIIQTKVGVPIDAKLLCNYFANLINRFFKILPMREQNEEFLGQYIRSLQLELLGCKELVCVIQYDATYLTLLSILQYLIDYPDCDVNEVKREVFHAISICEKISKKYADMGGA